MASRSSRGGSGGPIEFTVEQQGMQELAKALRAEEDGKALRRDLLRELKAAAAPMVTDLKAAINSAPDGPTPTQGQSLRQGIAAAIKPEVRLSGKNTGVSVRAAQTPGLRGFKHAARRFNRPSFRHRVFGRDVWVTQVGAPGWFDDTTKRRRDDVARAAMDAVEAMAERIARRVR